MSEFIFFILGGLIGFGIGGAHMASNAKKQMDKLISEEDGKFFRLRRETEAVRRQGDRA